MNLNKKLNKLLIKLVTAAFVLSGMIVFAASNETVSRALNITRPDVKIHMSAVVRRDEKDLPADEVAGVKSGEILLWRINSVNEGNASADNFQVVGRIPEGTSYVDGSANSAQKAAVSFSIDDGKEFSRQPLIDEKQADGSVKRVPAPVTMYTHLKFESGAPLAVNGQFESTYRVRVK